MSTHDDLITRGSGWERLLALLGSSRAQAAERYNEIRRRLVRLFEWRGLAAADDLADETLDRVARKLAGGDEPQRGDPVRRVSGVARLVALEAHRSARKLRPLSEVPEAPEPDLQLQDSRAEACLDECLGKIPEPARALLLDYHAGDGGARIENRKRLADRLGVPLNALRIRVHRLRAGLEECVERCVGPAEGGDAASS